jgi:hypothetical protein
MLLCLALPSTAQDAGDEDALIAQLSQMAAIMPASQEFDDSWRAYVRRFVEDMAEADAVIERVREGADDFRREIRVPGSGSGPPMRGYQLRDKMRALAAEVLGAEIPED